MLNSGANPMKSESTLNRAFFMTICLLLCLLSSVALGDPPAATQPSTQPASVLQMTVTLGGPMPETFPDGKRWREYEAGKPEGTLMFMKPLQLTIKMPSGRKFTFPSGGVILHQDSKIITRVTCFPGKRFGTPLEVLDQVEQFYRDFEVNPSLAARMNIEYARNYLGRPGSIFFRTYMEEQVSTEAQPDGVIGGSGSFLRFGFWLSGDVADFFRWQPTSRAEVEERRKRGLEQYRAFVAKQPVGHWSVEMLGPLDSLKGSKWGTVAGEAPLTATFVQEMGVTHLARIQLPGGKTVEMMVRRAWLEQHGGVVTGIHLFDKSMPGDLPTAVNEANALLKRWQFEPTAELKETMAGWLKAAEKPNYRLPFRGGMGVKVGEVPMRIELELTRSISASSWELTVSLTAEAAATQPTTQTRQ